jgi:hypothetical protein
MTSVGIAPQDVPKTAHFKFVMWHDIGEYGEPK